MILNALEYQVNITERKKIVDYLITTKRKEDHYFIEYLSMDFSNEMQNVIKKSFLKHNCNIICLRQSVDYNINNQTIVIGY